MAIASLFNHQPQRLEEIKGQDGAMIKLQAFFKTFKKGKGLFLYGPSGTGKTSSVYAYAKEHGYEVLELNASDARKQSVLKEFLSKATGQASLFADKKIILLDEIDGLSGIQDRGAASVIADYIKKSSFPIVATGVDPLDKKVKPIKKVSELIEFKPLTPSAITTVLEYVAKTHKAPYDEQVAKQVARNAAGDVRAALTDFFIATIDATSELALAARKQTPTLSQALVRVFKSTQPDVVFGAYDDVQEDLDKIFLWVDQNVSKEYTKPKDLDRAFDMIAIADRFFGRIRRWQYYRFYVYCYLLLSVGVALSKDEKYDSPPRYSQPSRLLKYWQANMTYAKRKNIIEKLANATSTSQKTALQDTYPLLLSVLVRDAAVQEELELEAEEIEWLQKQVA